MNSHINLMEEKKDPHEKQWRKLFEIYNELSTSKEDHYNRRAQACKSLLDRYC